MHSVDIIYKFSIDHSSFLPFIYTRKKPVMTDIYFIPPFQ